MKIKIKALRTYKQHLKNQEVISKSKYMLMKIFKWLRAVLKKEHRNWMQQKIIFSKFITLQKPKSPAKNMKIIAKEK